MKPDWIANRDSEAITPGEAAELLQISIHEVWRRLESERLPAVIWAEVRSTSDIEAPFDHSLISGEVVRRIRAGTQDVVEYKTKYKTALINSKEDDIRVLICPELIPELYVDASCFVVELPFQATNQPMGGRGTAVRERRSKGRRDGMAVAMEAGYQAFLNQKKPKPTARALFDWLADNDETGAILIGGEVDCLMYKTEAGNMVDVNFKAFQNRCTRMLARKSPQ